MYTILALVAIALLIVLLFQISKAGEYISDIKGEEDGVSRNDRFQASMFLFTLIFGMIGIVWSSFYYADKFLFLRPPMSAHSEGVNSMYIWTLISIVPVFFITQILLFWFAFKYKRDDNRRATFFPESNKLELIWMLVPAVVMVLLVFEGMRNWLKITGPAPETAMIIEATAQQFKWDIRYSGEDNQLGVKRVGWITEDNPYGINWEDGASKDDFMANEIVLVKDVPVKVKINSLDVLHSFYLPHFNVKMDAVPGIPTQFWFTPVMSTEEARLEFEDNEFGYELACAELCGKAHFNMRKEVRVVSQAEFDEWKAEQKTIYAQRVEAGLEKGTAEAESKEVPEEEEASSLSYNK